MKTVLFGLDGATFTVLDPLIQDGVMPNLAAFCRAGARAVLRSTPIPITPQAWTSMATGRSPGHHGLYDFIRIERKEQGIFWRVTDSRDNHCETLWHYASRQGKRVTVLNYFGIAPPRAIQGHAMPGFLPSRHLRRSTWPRDLFERLSRLPGLDVNLLGMDHDVEKASLQDMPAEQWPQWIGHHIEREEAWFQVLEHLMTHEPSDLTAIVLDGVDKIQHLAYRFLDPELAPARPNSWEADIMRLCRTYFRNVDRYLGRVVELAGPSGRVFIASDHGFTASREVVYINKWLHEQGLLCWREALGQDEQNAIFSERLPSLANAIDLPNTRAYAIVPISNGIYLNASPAEYDSIREDLIRRLQGLAGPDGGRVVSAVKRREECFQGPYLEQAPDVLLTLRDHGFVSVLNSRSAVVPRQHPSGTHHPDGVLLARGPGIRPCDAGQCGILDVAPALAHSLGLEIPAEYEGTLPEALYDADFLRNEPPRRTSAADGAAALPSDDSSPHDAGPGEEDMDETDRAILMARLRNLGYVE